MYKIRRFARFLRANVYRILKITLGVVASILVLCAILGWISIVDYFL